VVGDVTRHVFTTAEAVWTIAVSLAGLADAPSHARRDHARSRIDSALDAHGRVAARVELSRRRVLFAFCVFVRWKGEDSHVSRPSIFTLAARRCQRRGAQSEGEADA
jgi:hypothetical protein